MCRQQEKRRLKWILQENLICHLYKYNFRKLHHLLDWSQTVSAQRERNRQRLTLKPIKIVRFLPPV